MMNFNTIIRGDCIDVMKEFEENSIDCIVTDPPYGLSFMGKSWDKALPPKLAFIEMCRILKPGALAFVMSSPRQDLMWRMAQLLEESGFNLKQSFIAWLFAQGFPKSYDIAKGIDSKLGIKNIVDTIPDRWNGFGYTQQFSLEQNKGTIPITAPSSPDAKKWSGWKSVTGLKPALEVIFMVQKPLSESTIVDNVLKWGVGGMNVDACRIPTNDEIKPQYNSPDKATVYGVYNKTQYIPHELKPNGEHSPYGMFAGAKRDKSKGRFPANIIVSDDVLNDGKTTKSEGGQSGVINSGITYSKEFNSNHNFKGCGYGDLGSFSRYFDLDAWAEHHGILQVPKASSSERDKGLTNEPQIVSRMGHGNLQQQDGLTMQFRKERKNFHPCVKPVKLMSYLITLGCPKNGIVLDPFVGSGTTCVSAKMLGRKYIGIELDEEYFKIATERLEKEPETLGSFFKGEDE